MNHNSKPTTPLPPKSPEPVISDISIDGLIGDGLLVLYREIKNLLIRSVSGKLERSDSQDLRDHLKLLFEIKDREKDFLKNLSEEELKVLVQTIKDKV